MLPLILGGLGALKGILDNARAGEQQKVQAATTKWSPWTGMKAEAPKYGDILGGAMQGGLAGLMFNRVNPNLLGDGGGNPWDGLVNMKDDDIADISGLY